MCPAVQYFPYLSDVARHYHRGGGGHRHDGGGQWQQQKVLDQISTLGTNIINIRPGAPGMRPTGDVATLVPDDASVLADLDNVGVVAPERSARKTLRMGNIDYAVNVQGVGEGFPVARDWRG